MTWSMIAESSTVQVIGPEWSSVQLRGTTPYLLTLPYVAFMPAMLQCDAGPRIEPPVHEPSVAHAESPPRCPRPKPLLEPPGM